MKPFQQKRDVKGVAVEVNQTGKIFGEPEEGGENLLLGLRRIGKPLNQVPDTAAAVSTADQVNLVDASGEAGGLYVKKKQFVRPAKPLQGIGWRGGKRVLCGYHGIAPSQNSRQQKGLHSVNVL